MRFATIARTLRITAYQAVGRLFTIVLVSATLLTACGGGGSSSSSSSTTATIPAAGVYQGTYTQTGMTPVSVIGAIKANSYGYFTDTSGALYVLPSGIKSGSFSGTITAYAPIGQTFSNGQTKASFSVSGTASDDGTNVTSISGSFSNSFESGTFTLSYVSGSRTTLSLSSLAGSYYGYYWGSGSSSLSLTLNADGTFSGSDGYGCTFSGKVAIVSGYDLLTVTDTSTGNGCVGTLTGLAFVSTSDLSGLFGGATGTYVYIGVSNASYGFIAQIYK